MKENSEILTGYPIEKFLSSENGHSWDKENKAC